MSPTEPPAVLRYARDTRDWKRRLRRRQLYALALILVIGLLGYLGYRNVQRRVAMLNRMSQVGPVDWPTIIRSRTLLGLAWNLSSSDPDISKVGLFGIHKQVFDVALTHPLRHHDGLLELTVEITNTGTKKGIIPALQASSDYTYDDRLSTVVIKCGPYLGEGACVLAAGQTVRIPIDVQAPEQPSATSVMVSKLYGFGIGTQEFGFFEPLPYRRWEDVPKSLFTTPP